MSKVGSTVPGDLNPAFRSIPNLGIEPMAAQVAQQAAGAVAASTVLGSVPSGGTNRAPMPVQARSQIKRVTFVPTANVTGAATNNFTLNVYKKTPGLAAVLVASLTFGSGTNATAFEQVTLTSQTGAGVLLLGPSDSVYVQQVQNGTGLLCPAGVVQADLEPVG